MKKMLAGVFLLFTCTHLSAQTPQSLHFDGVDDHVTFSDFPDLGTSDFTIEFWFRMDTFPSSDVYLISKGLTTHGIPINAGFGFYVNNNGPNNSLSSVFSDGDYGADHGYLVGLQEDTWYHVALVRKDSMSGAFVNCNGNMLLHSTQPIANINTNLPFTIGAHDFGGFPPMNSFANGYIDEIRIWNVARSQQQLCDWKDCTIDVPVPGLVAVYNMDDSSGLILADNSGGNFHGVLVNGPSWSATAAADNPNCTFFASVVKDTGNELIVYPNPAQETLFVTESEEPFEYYILTTYGQQIATGKSDFTGSIDIAALHQGVYFLQVRTASSIQTIRFVKQ